MQYYGYIVGQPKEFDRKKLISTTKEEQKLGSVCRRGGDGQSLKKHKKFDSILTLTSPNSYPQQ